MSSVEKEEKRITRRDFAKGAAVVGAGVLASCASPTPQVVKETVEVPVEVTKIVKETVEVPVEVTKIVEKIVEVPAGEAGPVTLEVYNPAGGREVLKLHAPRIDTLEGKTICLIWNNAWQAHRTFPLVTELLQKQYPTAKIIPYSEFPIAAQDEDGMEEVLEAVKAAGCDVAITGNAG